MAEFISTLKTINPQVKVAYHSDGNIEKIIPDLIEIGLDVLNPVQPACMDPAKLKREYGDKLSFWGTIDEQFTLPSPRRTRCAGRSRASRNRRLRRGLILASTHHVQLDTPLENFWAMVTPSLANSDQTRTNFKNEHCVRARLQSCRKMR